MGDETPDRDEHRWVARPWLGFALQGVLTLAPLGLGVLAGRLAVLPLLPAEDTRGVLIAYAIAALVATLVVVGTQPLTRRLMPLAWLLRLQMLFPGRAPSRFKVARSRGRVVDLERALASGRLDTPSSAAERILGLVAVLTNHDRRTRGHAERVRVFTDLLSEEMGLSRDDRDRLRWAALLHDIGKLHVPRKVLNKPGKPDEIEWAILKEHPVHGEQLLGSLHGWLGEWGAAVREHHERWDGNGYPSGLAGREISLAARIVSVADAYEVMTAARSYKRPMAASAAREELVRCSGGQFDPHVVRAFMSIPLAKLRWALGPFTWVAELPILRQITHAGHAVAAGEGAAAAAGAAGTAAVTAASLVITPTPAAAEPAPRVPVAEAPAEPSPSVHATELPDGAAPHGGVEVAVPDVRPGESPTGSSGDGPTVGAGSERGDGGAGDGTDTGGGATTPSPGPTGGATDAVGETVDAVGDVVDRVVGDPVGTVGGTVEDPVGTVEGSVGSTVDAVGGAVGSAVETATETVGGLTGGLLGGR